MTEHKWLKFAGFLNECIFGLNHEACPYKKYRSMDQYQRLEHLILISEKEAEAMMSVCQRHQQECTPPMIQHLDNSWVVGVAI